jgi:hypothetical protein
VLNQKSYNRIRKPSRTLKIAKKLTCFPNARASMSHWFWKLEGDERFERPEEGPEMALEAREK